MFSYQDTLIISPEFITIFGGFSWGLFGVECVNGMVSALKVLQSQKRTYPWDPFIMLKKTSEAKGVVKEHYSDIPGKCNGLAHS